MSRQGWIFVNDNILEEKEFLEARYFHIDNTGEKADRICRFVLGNITFHQDRLTLGQLPYLRSNAIRFSLSTIHSKYKSRNKLDFSIIYYSIGFSTNILF